MAAGSARKARKDYVSYALIAGAIALGVVYVLDRDKPTTKEQGERAGLLLRVFRREEITRITLDHRGQKVELVKEGDAWKMTSPRVAKADFFAVESFLNELQGARSLRSLGEVKGGERAQLGLDAPRATAEIAMKGFVLHLALGSPATGAQTDDAGVPSAYLEVGPYGDQKGGVYVVEPSVASVLDRTADAFREPSLTGGHLSSQYSKVDVSGLVTLERGAHGTWRLPGGMRADADAANGFFLEMYQMKAAPFVADTTPVDVSKGATIEATLIEGGKLVVAFGGACPADPKLVVAQARSGSIDTGCIQPTTAERLKWPADRYVDEHAFGLIFGTMTAKISEIESVVIESGGKKVLDVERRGDGLHMRTPSEEQIEKTPTDAFFTRLANVSGPVVKSPDLAAIGLSPPAGKVTLKRVVEARVSADAGKDVWEQVVEVGTPDVVNKVIHLRRVDDGAVLRVPIELADAVLPAAVHALRSGTFLQIPADAIARISAHPEGAFAWDLTKKSGVWNIETPPGLGADPSTANRIATDLATLACIRFLDKDDGSFGKPRATIDIERASADDAGTEKMLTLEIGAEAKDGVLVRIKGRDLICVLPAEKIAAVMRPPFDVGNVHFDPGAHGKRLAITRDKRTRSIAFDDATKQWRDDGDAGADLLARKLGDAIHDLRATAIAHLGAPAKEEGFDTPTLVIEGFDGTTKKKTLRIGAAGPGGTFYARVDTTDATYLVNKADVDEILKNL